MAWIELHQSLWTHRKTVMLAALLEVDEIIAAAHMAKLWTWALDNAPNGEITGMPEKVIAFGAGWKGNADLFVNSIIESRFAERSDSSVFLHDWYDYAGRLVDKREANKLRMRSARATKKGAQHANVGGTEVERAEHVQRTNGERAENNQGTNNERAEHVQGLPNPTVPNQTKPKDKEPSSRQQKTYAEDSRPFKLAIYIRDRIQGVANELGRPHLIRNPNMQKWADTCRLMLENDKRDPHEVKDVIDWVSKHHFWQTNILSPESLRNKYADLCLKMAADKKGPTPKSGSGSGRQQEEGRTRSGKPNLPVVDRQTGPTLTPQEQAEMMERARRLRDDDRSGLISPTPEEREQVRAIARRMKEDDEKLRLPLGRSSS